MTPLGANEIRAVVLPSLEEPARSLYWTKQQRCQFHIELHGEALRARNVAATRFQTDLLAGSRDVINEYENGIVGWSPPPPQSIWQ